MRLYLLPESVVEGGHVRAAQFVGVVCQGSDVVWCGEVGFLLLWLQGFSWDDLYIGVL